MKTQTNTFQEYVTTDLLRDMPGLSTRRMFSGYGVYQGDIMFGLVVNGMLYFKVGEENRAAFKQYGSKPFFYYRQGKKTELASFWEVPPDIMEDRLTIEDWVEKSIEIARREKIQKEAKKSKPKTGLAGVKEKFHQLSTKQQNDLLRDIYGLSKDTKVLLESRLLGSAKNQGQYVSQMERETFGKIYRRGPKIPSGRAVNAIISKAKKVGVDLKTMLELEKLAYQGFIEFLNEFGGGPDNFEDLACTHLQAYLHLVHDNIANKEECQRMFAETAKYITSKNNMNTEYLEEMFKELVGASPAQVRDE